MHMALNGTEEVWIVTDDVAIVGTSPQRNDAIISDMCSVTLWKIVEESARRLIPGNGQS
jgi:hypothetical protein